MTMTDRRAFLAIAAGLWAPALRPSQGSAFTPRPCPQEAWRKGPIVMGNEGRHEDRWVQNFTSPAEPLDHGRWRIWYSVQGPGVPAQIGFAEGVPGEKLERHVAIVSNGDPPEARLAIGNLPEGWRLAQPVHLRLADGRHRLYFWARGEEVHRYLAADSFDGRSYRVINADRPCLYHPHDRAVDGRTAAEAGLPRQFGRKIAKNIAGETLATKDQISNDATNLDQLPDGSFEMYSVGLIEVPKTDPRYMAHDNAPGLIRVIDRRTSQDGLIWSAPQRILVPDSQDPIDQQFYYLSVTRTEQGRVGMLGHYRVQAQTMDLEWCHSVDGIHWERSFRRAWLPRGRPGSPDSYGIYAPHSLVKNGDLWWLFYTGVNSAHNGKDSHGEPRQCVLLAQCDSLWG